MASNSTPPLGDRIRDARKRRGLTQAGLAEHLGTNQQTVARWEQGQRPQPRLLAVLEVFLEEDDPSAAQTLNSGLQDRALKAFLKRTEGGRPLSPKEASLFEATFAAVGIVSPSGEWARVDEREQDQDGRDSAVVRREGGQDQPEPASDNLSGDGEPASSGGEHPGR